MPHILRRQRGGFPRCQQRQVPRSGYADCGDSTVAVLGGVALSRHAWLDSGYTLFVSLRRLGSFFFFNTFSTWLRTRFLRSLPVLLPARMEKCARMMLQLLEVSTRIFGHYFHEPVVSGKA